MNLYEIAADYRAVLDMMDDDESADLGALFDAIEGELVGKLDSIAALMREAEAEAEACKAEAQRLTERRKVAENRAARLKAYAMKAMEETGIAKVKGPRFSLTIRAGVEAVDVLDETAIPRQYAPEVVTVKPDKRAILAALKAGEQIPGVQKVRGAPSLLVR